MKKIQLLLVTLLISSMCYGQWNNVGQVIYGEPGEATGASCSINGIGDRIAIYDAFPNNDVRGRVRVFELQNGVWEQLGNGVLGLIGLPNTSAGAVVINQVGNRFIFSSPYSDFNGERSGGVRIFEFESGDWVQMGDTLYGEIEGDLFGHSVDISFDGNIVAIGATQDVTVDLSSGYLKVFEYQGNNWIQKGNTIIGVNDEDSFGNSIDLAINGSRLAVSAPDNDENGADSGLVRIFDFHTNDWVQMGGDILGDEAGDDLGNTLGPGANAISFDGSGTKIAIGSMGHRESGLTKGKVQMYEFQNNSWVQQGNSIVGSVGGLFSNAVNLNSEGTIMAIGAPLANGIGETVVYMNENGTWSQFGDTISGTTNSEWAGWCNDLNAYGNRLIVGAWFNDEGGTNAGKVDVFYEASLGVPEVILENVLSLFPNPNNGKFSLEFSEEIEITSIKVIDALGKIVYSETNIPSGTFEIDQNFTSGVYFVNVISTSSETTLKMILE